MNLEPSLFKSSYFSEIQFVKCSQSNSINPENENQFCEVKIVYQAAEWTKHPNHYRGHPEVPGDHLKVRGDMPTVFICL